MISRVKILNTAAIKNGRYVLYWMQASQRSEYNHALEYAILKANKLHKPLIVFFGILENYPEANERHFYFMLEGLKEVQSSLTQQGIQLVVWRKSPELGVIELAKNATLTVTDRGYLKIERKWRNYVAENIDIPFIQVESNVVLPVEEVSSKEEFSAATIRPKIKKKLAKYLVPLKSNKPKRDSLEMDFNSLDINDVKKMVTDLHIDRKVKKVHSFQGGTREAKKRLKDFIKKKLDHYTDFRNDPSLDYLSNMSPYLHFGQISPLYIALKINETSSPGKDAYLEELIIRRELSVNFVFYNRNYDSIHGIQEWAQETLREHKKDPRKPVYTQEDFERAETHDHYWNTAQNEMRIRGKMHGYMRMYWGKKIIEWSKNPEKAYTIALYLNNKYELDGRDPNGYTGVAWCFGKHDRPWKEREIFGKIRYMSAGGLERKFNIGEYVKNINHIEHEYNMIMRK